MSLPEEFADLEPYVEKWALGTEAERNATRLATDIEAIQALKTQYGRYCDPVHNLDGMVGLFTEDAVFDIGEEYGSFHGRDEIRAFLEGADDIIPWAIHYNLSPQIELGEDGVSAHGTWYLWQLATMPDPDGGGQTPIWIAGVYHDDLVKVDGEWRFSKVALRMQMVDAVFLNANDLKEVFHAGMTAAINMMNDTGTMQKVTQLYSKPPRDNVMLEVVEDPVGVHLAWNGGRCSRSFYAEIGQANHRNCQDNLAEVLAPYGLSEDDVPDVFNAFMNVAGIEEGRFETVMPVSKKGDYISLRADMDILAAVSACPFDLLYTPRPLQIQIVQPD